jgi:hypothetical protein
MSQELYPPPNKPSKVESHAIPIWVYLICGWPFALVAIGGMIGGLCGGAAFGINLSIWKSSLPLAAKIILIPIVGFTAIGVWLVAALGLRSLITQG